MPIKRDVCMFALKLCPKKKCEKRLEEEKEEEEEEKKINVNVEFSKLTFLFIAIIYFSFPIARLFFNVKCQTGRTGNLFQSGASTSISLSIIKFMRIEFHFVGNVS